MLVNAEPLPENGEQSIVALLTKAWVAALGAHTPPRIDVTELPGQLGPIAHSLITSVGSGAAFCETAWTCGSALADIYGPHPRILGVLSTTTLKCLSASATLAEALPTLLGYLATGFLAPRASTFSRAHQAQAAEHDREPQGPALAALPSVMWITDRELRPISIDGGMANVLAPLLHAQAALDKASNFDLTIPIETLRNAHLHARKGIPSHFRIVADGHIFDGWLKPLHDQGGEISGCAGVAVDVSVQLPVAPQEDKSGPWYQELVETIEGVVWESDLETGRYTYVSPRAESLLGYPLEQWTSEGNFWVKTAHPDDVANIRHELNRAGNIKPTYQIEYRARTADGRWVWLCNGFTILREEGQPIRARGVIMDVTRYKQAEQALRESEERFRAVFDRAGIGIALIDPDGNLTLSNGPLQRMLGRSAEELHGHSLTALSHPDDMWISRPLFDAIVRGERDTFHQEKRYLHKKGQVVWANLVTSAMREPAGERHEVICIVEDATARKQIETQLQHQLGLTQAIIASFRGGLCALDRDGKATYINPAAEQMLGWSEAELLGVNLLEQLVPGDQGAGQTSWRAVTQRGQVIAIDDAQFVKRNGSIFPVGYTLSPIMAEHGVMGAVLGFRELTEQKRLQAELTTVNRLVAESREEAQQHLARELHDGALQLLIGISYQMGRRLATLPDQEMREMRQSVLDVVVQLRGLLGELRPAGLEELGLATALEGYIARLSREGGPEAPEIVLEVIEGSSELALPTARCIFRVAQEGLRNILRHARAQRVDLQLRIGEEEAILTVRDNGIGFNVPSSLSALTHSNHFGLVGMAERVALANGQLSIRSQPGHGTAIFLRLPTTIGNQAEAKARSDMKLTSLFENSAVRARATVDDRQQQQ